MIPKISYTGTLLTETAKTRQRADLIRPEGYHHRGRPDIYRAETRNSMEKSCHARQDELSRLLHRAGYAVEKRFARREGFPRHCGLANRRGHQRTGSCWNHRREPDAVA